MLLTMSSVVISLTLPQLFRNVHLWPLLILVGFCLLTVCLAAYAVMPKLPPVTGMAPDVNDPGFNPLFFGDFTRMSQQHFESTMADILSDPSRTYAAQVREIYLLGLSWRAKYRFLRLGLSLLHRRPLCLLRGIHHPACSLRCLFGFLVFGLPHLCRSFIVWHLFLLKWMIENPIA